MSASRPWALAMLVLAAILSTGCGRQDEVDLVNGKRLFIGEGQCVTCHVLERAGGGGALGPNLDEAFGPSRRDGLGRQTVEGIVLRQIDQTRRGSIMPEDLVTGDDARDVAAYVAQAAGVPGTDTGGLATAGEPLAQPSERGKQIFIASGCGSCHALSDVGTSGTVGPSLDNLAGASPQPGLSAEEYVRESIVDPETYVVKGFARDGMPDYSDRLDEAEVTELVGYLARVTR